MRGKDYLVIAFLKTLIEGLFPDNAFYKQSVDDSAFIAGEEVLLPHAGTIPNVEIDRTTDGTPTKRQDTHHKYTLHELTTDPTKLKIVEEMVANYAKRESIIYNHRMALNNMFAKLVAHKWVASSNIKKVATTGSGRVSSYGTGNRKALTLDDLLSVQEKLNDDNVPLENRNALITPKQLRDLLKIKEVQSSDFNKVKALVNGSVGTFLGFNFFVRSETIRLTSAGNVRDITATTTADTDTSGAIFWQKEFVRRAEGKSDVLINRRDATVYGDVISALCWGSGTHTRKDSKGVILLHEPTV